MQKEPNIFGQQIGNAIAGGAKDIASGLERRYMGQQRLSAEQRAIDERMRQEQLQPQEMALKAGFDMSPDGFAQFMQSQKNNRNLENQKAQAEIGLINKRSEMVDQKAPMGYRYNEMGNLEAIPGGLAYQKEQEKDIKKQQADSSYRLKIDNMKSTIDSALGQIGYSTAGMGGRILSSFGATGPIDLEGALNTIKSNLGFDRLTQMRAESPTGGALGNVSDRELQLLTSTVQSLDQRQSPTTLKKNLEIIKGYLDDTTAIKQTGMSKNETPLSPEEKSRLQELRAKRGI